MESGGPGGYDAGRKIKGKWSYIVTYKRGLTVETMRHAADSENRDGAPDVLTIFLDQILSPPNDCDRTT